MRPSLSVARVWSRPKRAVALLGLFALLASLLAQGGLAQEQPQGKTITLGESLTDPQRQELLDYFEADADDDTIETVTNADTVEAMQGIFDMTGITTAFSSTALTCRTLGDGLDVTTRNIQTVTPALYAMALVTAGIGDADLVVAAPIDLPGVTGLTALTGVFKTWDVAPCESGDTSADRQRLALEELTLTVTIGLSLYATGSPDGIQRASVVVLETQKAIVIQGLKEEGAIDAALAAEEANQGVTIAPEQRDQLVDMFVRLAAEEIDWSTFAAGWTIEYKDVTRITMRGEGIAIRNAQASATAEAAALTATADAQANAASLTATAEAAAALAALTATAQANAAATAQAIADMTATVQAIPTATPIPPTPTPAPSTVIGKVVSTTTDEVVVRVEGATGDPAPYKVDPAATVSRDGKPVAFAKVGEGDSVQMVVDGNTKLVTDLIARPAPASFVSKLTKFLWVLPLGLVVPAILWVKGRLTGDPFVVKRVA